MIWLKALIPANWKVALGIVLVLLLLLFCGAALGLAFKAGHDRAPRGPSEAEVIKGLEEEGWESADSVKEIKKSLVAEHLEATTEEKTKTDAALKAETARVTLQMKGELDWAKADVRETNGSLRAMRATLTECEGRVRKEILTVANTCPPCDPGEVDQARARMDGPVEMAPCSPGEVQIRGGCAVEILELTDSGHQMGGMIWNTLVAEFPRGCGEQAMLAHLECLDSIERGGDLSPCDGVGCGATMTATRGPELVPDVTFKLARDKGKTWNLLGHLGADRKSEATVFDGVAGTQSPEHLTLTQNRYSLAAGATLLRTKHGLTVIGRANGDGIDGATAMWTIKLAGD